MDQTNIIILKKPFDYEGTLYTEIKLDLDSLTGKDMISAEAEARVMGDRTVMLEASKTYHMIVAAKAAKLPVDFFEQLPAKEFTRVTAHVQNFLFE